MTLPFGIVGISNGHRFSTPKNDTRATPLPPGRQEWGLGYALEPDWHGRGVTSELLRIILDEWVGRWLGIGSVSAVRAPFVSGISPEGGGLARWGEEGDVVV